MIIKKLLILLTIANIGFLKAQYTAIPDINFESILVQEGIDSEGIMNGQVLTSDVEVVTFLNVAESRIFTLEGIEDFIALEELICEGNLLTELNISNSPNLEILFCSSNFLNELDVSNNLSLQTLTCYNNNLNSLDVTSNTILGSLECGNNNLSTLNVTQNLLLQKLWIYSNNFTSIDISLNVELTRFDSFNNNISNLDCSTNTLLTYFSCSNNNITTLDLSNNTLLNTLFCKSNTLNTLNINNNNLLDRFNCSNNNLTTLDIQNGANELLNGTYEFGNNTFNRFNATDNLNLTCIFVDDIENAENNWLGVDVTSTFVETQEQCETVAVTDYEINNAISIYPNPIQNYFAIDDIEQAIIEVKIYTLLGDLVKTFTTQKKYNSRDLAKGVYMVSIKTDKGYTFKKLIKN